MRAKHLVSVTLTAIVCLAATAASAQTTPAESSSSWPDRTILPIPLSPFEGKIGKDYTQSESAWQQVPTALAGAPNVLIILLDDVGFGQPSTFGGLIPTPSLDKLAGEGIRFNDSTRLPSAVRPARRC